MSDWRRIGIALGCGLMLSACTEETGPSPHRSPGEPGSAVVDAAGGTVQATLTGGGSLTLSVPAGALLDTVTITIEPLEPSGTEYAAFRLAPGGLELLAPATFTAVLPAGRDVAPAASVTLDWSGVQVPLASEVDPIARTVVASLSRFGSPIDGVASSGRPSRSAPTSGSAIGSIDLSDYEARISSLIRIAAVLQTQGSFENAEAFILVLESIVFFDAGQAASDNTVSISMDAARPVVCGQYEFALSDLSTFAVASAIQVLFDRIRQVFRWGDLAVSFDVAAAAIGQGGCTPPLGDASAAIVAKLTAFLPSIEQELERFDASTLAGFESLLRDRIRPLLDLLSSLSVSTTFDSVSQAVTRVVGGQFTRLRRTAYAACSGSNQQDLQNLLIFLEAGDLVVQAASPYSGGDLGRDAQLCGMGVTWQTLQVGGSIGRSGTLGGGADTGATVRDTLTLSPGDTLELSGPARSLVCAPGNGDGGDLQVRGRIGLSAPTQLASRPAGPTGYFGAPLTIPGAALRTLAGLPPSGVGLVLIELQRTGDFCDLDFDLQQHSVILTLEIRLSDHVQITTTGLPAGEVGVEYQQIMTATGGTGVYTWSIAAGSLPPGLSLAAASGLISGTPGTEGNSTVTIRATSGGESDTVTFTTRIDPNSDPPLVITTTSLPVGRAGSAYSAVLTATGGGTGPFVWSAGGLPPGLTLGPSGIITGTPTTSDTVTVSVQVNDGRQSASAALELQIEEFPLRITTGFIGTALPDTRFTPSIPMSVQLQAAGGTGGPYTWTLVSGVLPLGTVMSASGLVAGDVTGRGSPTITIRVSDGVSTDESVIEVRYVCCFF